MNFNRFRASLNVIFLSHFVALAVRATHYSNGVLSSRSGRAISIKDPIAIIHQKCEDYATARYNNITTPGVLTGDSSIFIRELDCVQEYPLKAGVYPIKEKEYPHLAFLGVGEKLENASWTGTGSLISDQFILSTASHAKEAKWAALGLISKDAITSDKLKKNVFKIIETFVHPGFKASSPHNDIALYKIETVLTFTSRLRPTCLYTSNEIPPEVQNKATVTGWGRAYADEPESNNLRKAKIDFIEPHKCVERRVTKDNLNHNFDPKSMVCAGNLIGEDITCMAQGGGPLQVPIPFKPCVWSQVGITSYGSSVCEDDTPTIFTKVSNYLGWIQSIVWP